MPYRRTRPLNVTPESPQIAWGDSINKGLVAYYPCNEPGGLKVRCAVNPAQNLTLSSGYTSRLSGPGGAHGRGLKFTSATQYAQGALVKAVTGGPCTVACWITIDAMPSVSAILVALGSSAATDVEYITYIYANNLNWGHSGDDLQPSTAPVSAGQRVFVVGSTNSAKLQSLYKNGWLAGTRTATAFPTVSSTVTLGGQFDANTGNNFLGSIDNVRIYNRALSQSEVTRLYQEPLAGVVSPRRRTVGAVSADITLALTGNAITFAVGAILPSLSVGIQGNAATFGAGTVTAIAGGNITLTLAGNAIVSAAGALGMSASTALTGNAATSAIGLLGPQTASTLAGNTFTGLPGALAPTSSFTLIGNSSVNSVGQPGVSFAAALSGNASLFAVGTVVSVFSVSLGGRNAAFTAGTVIASTSSNVTLALIGNAATSAVGTLTLATTVSVLGQQGLFATGTIIAVIGTTVTVALTGNKSTFQTGTLLPASQSTPLPWTLSSDGNTLTCGVLTITYNGLLQLPYILTIRGAAYTYTTLWMTERAADTAYIADPTILLY